jgi:leader peptidase (prepilin peptidase)/N-methyltransferase
MMTVSTLLAASGVFAALAFTGTAAARSVVRGAQPFEDGPPPGRPNVAAIVAAGALLGAGAAARSAGLPELGLCAVLTLVLAGVCYADMRCGLVPDVFTLAPLAAVLAGDALLHQWSALAAVLIVAGPFALAARLSKGRGMGWGDVKLVALGAAVLGAEPALLGFVAACFAAVAVAAVRGRRSTAIAFAPYLACAIAVGVAVRGVA